MNSETPIAAFVRLFSDPSTAGATISAVAKFSILFALSLYLIFGVVVIRQVSLMAKTIDTHINSVIKLMASVHMVAALLVWFLAFVLL